MWLLEHAARYAAFAGIGTGAEASAAAGAVAAIEDARKKHAAVVEQATLALAKIARSVPGVEQLVAPLLPQLLPRPPLLPNPLPSVQFAP